MSGSEWWLTLHLLQPLHCWSCFSNTRSFTAPGANLPFCYVKYLRHDPPGLTSFIAYSVCPWAGAKEQLNKLYSASGLSKSLSDMLHLIKFLWLRLHSQCALNYMKGSSLLIYMKLKRSFCETLAPVAIDERVWISCYLFATSAPHQ